MVGPRGSFRTTRRPARPAWAIALAVLAAGAALVGCPRDPGGLCSRDADCARGPAGLFCAEGLCQSPPRATLLDVPIEPVARSAIVPLRVRVDRAHGGPARASVRFEAGAVRAAGALASDGTFHLDAPASFAPAGAEGPAAFEVVVADDLGHETRLSATLFADDLGPRIAVDPASIPAAPVLRGTEVPIRVTLTDASPSTLRYSVAGGPEQDTEKQPDGSFIARVQTKSKLSPTESFGVRLVSLDTFGNSIVKTTVVLTRRLSWKASPATVRSVVGLVLGDRDVFATAGTGPLILLDRTSGDAGTTGGDIEANQDAIGDPSGVYTSQGSGAICKVSLSGEPVWCCMGMGTIKTGLAFGILPRDGGTAPTIVAASSFGTHIPDQRLFAIAPDDSGTCQFHASAVIESFDGTGPTISADGTVYIGATQSLVAAAFDGLAWSFKKSPTPDRYTRHAALLAQAASAQDVIVTTTKGLLQSVRFPLSAGLPATPAAIFQLRVSSDPAFSATGPTVDARGDILLGTEDGRAVAVDKDGHLLWSVPLPGLPTVPPTQGEGDIAYFATDDGTLLALSVLDGSTLWTFSAGAAIRTPPALGCDGVLYFGTDVGDVFALVTDSAGLADSPWPRAGHDNHGTADARRPLRSPSGGCLE